MHVLIIGVSNIVIRRVLPALAGLDEVEQVHLASRRDISADLIPAEKRGRVFQGYTKALSELAPCLVYLSLPNSMHAEWTRKSLEAGFHVVVDKPAFTTLTDTESLLELGNRQGLCLAEATVWNWHPQFELIKNVLCEAGLSFTRVSAIFSFPPFEPTNFRCDPKLGGGSLLDLGPYATSCGRVFFGEMPTEVVCRVHSWAEGTGVDTSFSLLACYRGGRALVGHFGFNTEYRNAVSLLGAGIFVEIGRTFTLPADFTNQLRIQREGQVSLLVPPPGDSFRLFIRQVIAAMQKLSWSQFYEAIWQDAQFLHQMRCSAGVI